MDNSHHRNKAEFKALVGALSLITEWWEWGAWLEDVKNVEQVSFSSLFDGRDAFFKTRLRST